MDPALRWLRLSSRVIELILAEALHDGPFRAQIFIIAAIDYLLRLRRTELHEQLLSIDDHLLLEDGRAYYVTVWGDLLLVGCLADDGGDGVISLT